MKKLFLKSVLLVLTVCMLAGMFSACKGAETVNEPKVTGKTPEEIGGLSPTPEGEPSLTDGSGNGNETPNGTQSGTPNETNPPTGEAKTYHTEEVQPIASPECESVVGYFNPSSTDSFFATLTSIVRGKVIKTTEYKFYGKDKNGNETEGAYYFTAVELKVDKFYGGEKLKYRGTDTIVFKYSQNSHEHYVGERPIKVGDECFVFLTDVNTNKYSGYEVLSERVDYILMYSNVSACFKESEGYSALGVMSLIGKTKEHYTLKEVEKFIKDNIDKIRNISELELFLETYGS